MILGKRLLIEPIVVKEKVTEGGIISLAKDTIPKAAIIEVSEEAKKELEELGTPLAAGDTILYVPGGLKLSDTRYYLPIENVIAKV